VIAGKAAALAAIALCVACGPRERAPGVTGAGSADPPGAEVAPAGSTGAEREVVVRSGAQATIGELRIGAGNIWADADDALSAQLWIHTPQPAARHHPRVVAGQVVEAGGASISIVSVERDAVKLRVARGTGG
jgi:hypothetical protein